MDAEDIIEAVRSLEAAKEQFSDELRERARDGGDGWGMEQYVRNVSDARDRLERTLTTYINDRIAAYLEARGK